MRIDDAISRIAEIHAHLDKSEVYCGYRALPVALSGATALIGAVLQPLLVADGDALAYVLYWLNIALISGLICGVGILRRYLNDSAYGRRQAHRTVGQFIPCLAAGSLVTLGVVRVDLTLVAILPGLWSILFALGIFSSRPYLPRAAGWIACFYLVMGAVLLWLAPGGGSLSPWAMGWTFGCGQIVTAGILYWNIERKADV